MNELNATSVGANDAEPLRIAIRTLIIAHDYKLPELTTLFSCEHAPLTPIDVARWSIGKPHGYVPRCHALAVKNVVRAANALDLWYEHPADVEAFFLRDFNSQTLAGYAIRRDWTNMNRILEGLESPVRAASN